MAKTKKETTGDITPKATKKKAAEPVVETPAPAPVVEETKLEEPVAIETSIDAETLPSTILTEEIRAEIKQQEQEEKTTEETKKEANAEEELPNLLIEAMDEKLRKASESTQEEKIAAIEATAPVVLPRKELSKQAAGWRDWLAYMKITPEQWMAKHPNHKMKHLVEELIAYNAAN